MAAAGGDRIILNFLTGNRLEGDDITRIRTEDGDQVVTPEWSDNDILGPSSGADAIWKAQTFPDPSPELAAELQFMEDIGVAVAREPAGTWWIWQEKRDELYGAGGIFEGDPEDTEPLAGQIRNLMSLFRDLVLPAYATVSLNIAQTLPPTVQEGNYLSAMAARFNGQIQALGASRTT